MTFFFLVVGLEAKRALDMGQAASSGGASRSARRSIGGMALPIAIYLAFNAGGSGANGWGPLCRPTPPSRSAFLALVAPSGTRLRVRLLTLAVADDLVALLVIHGVLEASRDRSARHRCWPLRRVVALR